MNKQEFLEQKSIKRQGEIEKYEVVMVTWLDATAENTSWHLRKTVKKEKLGKCVSVGFKLVDDERKIILAATVEKTYVGGILVISKSLTEKVEPLGFCALIDKRMVACNLCYANDNHPLDECPAIKVKKVDEEK